MKFRNALLPTGTEISVISTGLGSGPDERGFEERVWLGRECRVVAYSSATSLKGCCSVDCPILSLTHSATITALNNSCTDTPLSLASADIVWYGSSRMDNMNLAMAGDLRLFLLPVV